MITSTMATGPQKDSRYRALRGKSVSEFRRELDQPSGDPVDGTALSSLRVTTSNWRRRAKAEGHMVSANASVNDLHSLLLSVPPLPHPQKEHTSTTRPKAAVVPLRPEFGRPESPAPLKLQTPDQINNQSPCPVNDVVVSQKSAAAGDHNQRKELEDLVEQSAQNEHGEQPLEHQDTIHQHGRRDPSPLSRLEAEADRKPAEPKMSLHEHLVSTDLAAESMQSLASTFSFATRTPPKSPILEKLGFFAARGRNSRAILSPAASTIASKDSYQTQSTEPLLSSRSCMSYSQQLMTPPVSPISSYREAVVSNNTYDLGENSC